jgi:hypothetical protein
MNLYRLTRTWDPGRFQGRDHLRGYFEGWYFKLVSADLGNVLAVIPGLSRGADGTSGAFIQVLDGRSARSWFVHFPLSDFQADDRRFDLRIGGCQFSARGIELSLNDAGLRLEGRLSFSKLAPWPVSLASPGAMGWYAFVPKMECYHGVLSFDHGLAGTLVFNGQNIDFTGGRGYLEKDWGTSFPAYHIWCQSNSFGRPGISVMASIARIPWRGSWFDGFLAALLLDGRLYRFTTYSRAHLSRLLIGDNLLEMHFQSHRHRLEITAPRPGGAALASPVLGSMASRLKESLAAHLDVRLVENPGNTGKVLFEGTGSCAGLEIEATREQLKDIP